MTPEFTPGAPELPLPPVTLAAVGPVMVGLAAEVADGVLLHGFCTTRYLDETIMPRIERGLTVSGLSRENFKICGGGFIATGPDNAAVDRAVETMRYRIGFYSSTPAYWPVLETHGYGDLGRKLNAMTKAGAWDRLATEIPDDLLTLFCAVGRHDEIVAAIKARFGGASDVISTGLDEDIPPDLIQDLQRIKSPFTGFATGKDAA